MQFSHTSITHHLLCFSVIFLLRFLFSFHKTCFYFQIWFTEKIAYGMIIPRLMNQCIDRFLKIEIISSVLVTAVCKLLVTF